MSVTREQLLHVADLARLRIPPNRVDGLLRDLNAILGHMDVLGDAGVGEVEPSPVAGVAGMPLRPDQAPPLPLDRPLGNIAPSTRDGFVIVPRLATHEDAG